MEKNGRIYTVFIWSKLLISQAHTGIIRLFSTGMFKNNMKASATKANADADRQAELVSVW